MIIVCPLSQVDRLVAEHEPGHIISLLGPDMPHRSFGAVPPERHLKLTFHDIVQPREGYTPAGAGDAARLIAFLNGWPRQSPLLIHCWAGISRSTAAAYTALCLLRPAADENELALELRTAAPSATPNRLIVSLADQALKRDGRMVRGVERIGRGADAFEGTPFVLRP